MDDLVTIIRSGMWRLQYKLSAEGKKRFFTEFFPLLHDTKTEVLGDRDLEAWYLVYIGTKPSSRRHGYAKHLIEYVSNIADREKRPCYLESSADIATLMYRHLGYEERKKIKLERAEKDVLLDILVREPRESKGQIESEV